ncbi:MAG: hypothetical protein N2116_05650 [Armatimonadetes bacterium]|nr:hypothetical protein [Armatimonadota bacterium]
MTKDKGQFLAKAKTLIVQNIQNRTVFTRGDLSRFLSLDPKVEESIDYLVTLQTLTEQRYIDWFEEPDRGRFIPGAPANLNSVWDIASTPPAGFVSDTQIYPIAGSQQVFACPVCSGSGSLTVACYSCAGSGRRVCSHCSGAGMEICRDCNGSGVRTGFNNRLESCTWCKGSGRKICYSCDGKGGEVCGVCGGTGRVIERCSKCAGIGRLIRYQAVVCVFKPHEFNEVVSQWNLPLKEFKAAEASNTRQTFIQPSSPSVFGQIPPKVQNAINFLASQAKGLEVGDTRLVRTQLTVKEVPVARISFRLYGVFGDAWFLGKDFQRVYLPKVPLTFETWLKLKDWVSVGLTVLSLIGFVAFTQLIRQEVYNSAVMVWFLIASCAAWVVSGLVLIVRRFIAGLVLFAITITALAAMIAYQKGQWRMSYQFHDPLPLNIVAFRSKM